MLLETEVLNDVQSAAVRHTDGPVLIFAGAGSGKTRVLTHRIAYLLNELRVAPDRMLAVTFTNKAAGEMKTRLQNMVGTDARDVWVGTFHSMCVRILRRDGSRIGIAPTFAVIDDTDQRQLVREIRRRSRLRRAPDFAGRLPRGDRQSEERVDLARRVRPEPDVVPRRAHRQRLHRVSAPPQRVELARLRRSHRPHDRPARTRQGRARSISASSSTSSSTNTKTSTPRSTGWSRCSPPARGTLRSSATTTSRFTRGAAATTA